MTVNGQIPFIDDAPDPSPGVSCDPTVPTMNALRPCPSGHVKQWNVNTAQAPFVNGANAVQVCAIDYALNAACINPGTVYVSN
jgi:hypothetical protein